MDLSTLEQHVMMAIAALQPTAYGISIKGHISDRADYEPSLGSIYAALGRLEDKGYIQSRTGEATPERGGRAKLYFSLTAPGQATLQQSLRAIQSLERGLRWKDAFGSIEVCA